MNNHEPTRADLEFLADCLGTVEQKTIGGPPHMRPRQRYGHVQTAALTFAVVASMTDPIANARAQSRITDLLRELPGDVPENDKPTRDDLRLMAECLGLRPDVDYKAHEYLLSDVPSLADAVNGRMLDPIANGRARMRMFGLLRALPLPRETAVLRPSA